MAYDEESCREEALRERRDVALDDAPDDYEFWASEREDQRLEDLCVKYEQEEEDRKWKAVRNKGPLCLDIEALRLVYTPEAFASLFPLS